MKYPKSRRASIVDIQGDEHASAESQCCVQLSAQMFLVYFRITDDDLAELLSTNRPHPLRGSCNPQFQFHPISVKTW